MEKKNAQQVEEATEKNEVILNTATSEVKGAPVPGVTKWTPQVAESVDDDYEDINVEPEYMEGEAVYSGLTVVRRKLPPRQRGAKPVFVYEVNGNLRGEDITVSMNPPDKRGYKLLSLVFGGLDELPLMMVPYAVKDEKTGKVTSQGFTYRVESENDEGLLGCKLRAANSSDKAFLECLIAKAQKTL